MKLNPPEIRELSDRDIVQVYGKPFDNPVKGLVVEQFTDIKVVTFVMFAEINMAFTRICSEDVRKYPKTLVLLGRMMDRLMSTIEEPIYTIAPDTHNAREFAIRFCGFKYLQDLPQGALLHR